MFFCFFKQKTAYEMRISDWSSDVCSSDLKATGPARKKGSGLSWCRWCASGASQCGSALVLFDELGGIAHGSDLFSRIVGDFHAELFFEGHHQDRKSVV